MRRWLLDDDIVSREWIDGEIAASVDRFADGGCGLWALRELPSAAIVGFVGFRPFWDPPRLELVYGLHPAAWGRGLATEAGHAAVSWAFETLRFPEIHAATDVPNSASISVLGRLGFEERDRTTDGPAGTVHFRLDIERWRRTGALC